MQFFEALNKPGRGTPYCFLQVATKYRQTFLTFSRPHLIELDASSGRRAAPPPLPPPCAYNKQCC